MGGYGRGVEGGFVVGGIGDGEIREGGDADRR